MKNQPFIKRSGILADAINIFLMRSIYRDPKNCLSDNLVQITPGNAKIYNGSIYALSSSHAILMFELANPVSTPIWITEDDKFIILLNSKPNKDFTLVTTLTIHRKEIFASLNRILVQSDFKTLTVVLWKIDSSVAEQYDLFFKGNVLNA